MPDFGNEKSHRRTVLSSNLIHRLKLNSVLKRISLLRPHGTAFVYVYKEGNTFPTGAVDVIDQSILVARRTA
jgi:hypothetical protein